MGKSFAKLIRDRFAIVSADGIKAYGSIYLMRFIFGNFVESLCNNTSFSKLEHLFILFYLPANVHCRIGRMQK